MPDWGIATVAAVVGAVVGAVLQPAVAHLLERLRSGQQTHKGREAQMRRMVEARLEWARFEGIVVAAVTGLRRQGIPTPPPRAELNNPRRPRHAPAWRPERIRDPKLREKALQHAQLFHQLQQLFMFGSGDEQDARELARLAPQLDGLDAEMIQRMDEMNWPEVDD